MTVTFKAPLKSQVTNDAYVSKSADDTKTGKLTLNDPSETGPVDSTQGAILEQYDTDGSSEGDANRKVYSSNNVITDGDNRKTAIGKLDAGVQSNTDALATHIADTSAHDGANIDYDNTTSGLTATKVSPAIDEVEGRVESIETSVGAANGICPLDSGSKVPTANLPDSVLGALQYQGAWNANTNTPTITSGVGTQGHYYVVSVAGTTNIDGISDWEIGDWITFNGTVWEKIDNSDKVSSVNGQTGVVVLDKTDIGLTNVTDDAQLKRSANDFTSFTNKTSIADADAILIEDSADSFNKKYILAQDLLANAGGGGGGGSFIWELNSEDASPFESTFSGISVFDFDEQSNAEMFALITVPDSYTAGVQINLIGAKFFSSASSNNVLFRCETQLLKTSVDMSTLPLTGHTSTNTELTLSTANALSSIGNIDLTDGSGEVNAIAVAAGDILLIKFYRDNDNETTSATADARFLKFSAGVSFV